MTDTVLAIIKRPGCRQIKLLSGDSMTIPLPVFKKAPLAVGQSVMLDAYRQRVLPMEAGLALEQASRMLMAKDRSEAEIRRRLNDVGYAPETVAMTVAKLLEARVLDDSRYLENYLNTKAKRLGEGRIKRELMQKGIATEAIEHAMTNLDPDLQLEAAVKHARKALSRGSEDKRHRAHLAFAALARRGFSPAMASRAIDIALSGLEEQEADGFPG